MNFCCFNSVDKHTYMQYWFLAWFLFLYMRCCVCCVRKQNHGFVTFTYNSATTLPEVKLVPWLDYTLGGEMGIGGKGLGGM